MKTYLKFLSRNKAYTFIDVFGLSVSLLFVILIAVYTVQELSTDKFQENAERIYLLSNEKYAGSAYRIADRIKERYPEIEKVCPMTSFYSLPVSIDGKKYSADFLLADTTFFDMFSFPLVSGERDRVLEAKNNAVLSESFARKVFADKEPLGQTIQLYDSLTFTVSGIMKDIKNSTICSADILIRMDNVRYLNPGMDSEIFQNAVSSLIFIQAKEGADLLSKAEDMASYFKEIFWIYQRGIVEQVRFVPLREAYFLKVGGIFGLLKQGDKSSVLILMSVGMIILLFALINYINLTVAQTGFRAKEMATRRLLGSNRSELFFRLIMEAVLLSFVSFVIGLFLAFLFGPIASNLLETPLDIAAFIF